MLSLLRLRRMLGIVIGTGPSLSGQIDTIKELQANGALLFGPNNTYQDFDLDVWLACDPAWHGHYGRIDLEHVDQWHWNRHICDEFGYRYVEGIWMDGLWIADKSKISLNHCSGAQLLNLACIQYECSAVLLVGHDFHYDGPQRHYFSDLSDVAGEYPSQLRKYSKFIKPEGNDLLEVYRHIADQKGLPPIINCTPGSALRWFPKGELEEWL